MIGIVGILLQASTCEEIDLEPEPYALLEARILGNNSIPLVPRIDCALLANSGSDGVGVSCFYTINPLSH